jgi:hypothetical protein
MALTFVRADTLGEGWTLQVRKGPRVVGRIIQRMDGQYRFYKGAVGPGTPSMQQPELEDDDLEQLKARIESSNA